MRQLILQLFKQLESNIQRSSGMIANLTLNFSEQVDIMGNKKLLYNLKKCENNQFVTITNGEKK
jgi:hypothetical protein